ncbi:20144_t:CDS:2, partial [Racocetra fulgida]
IKASKRLFRLPFEFDDDDKLGQWDILLSENAIKDIQKLESDVDYGFSIRIYEFTQLVKVWAVAENIDEILKNLALAHESYTKEHSAKCRYRQTSQDGSNLPIIFGGEETTKSSEDGLRDPQLDDEKLLEIHEMLVTNKFTPISK